MEKFSQSPAPPVPRGQLTISLRAERTRVYIVPHGEIDLANVHEVAAELEDLRNAGSEEIVIDLRQTAFIDSTMLRFVLRQAEAAESDGWKFGLVPGPPPVQRVFEITQTLGRLNFVSADV